MITRYYYFVDIFRVYNYYTILVLLSLNNNNTHEAVIGCHRPHPHNHWQSYTYIYIQANPYHLFLPHLHEEHNLPSICPSTPVSCRSSAKDWSWLGYESSPYTFVYAPPRHLQHIPSLKESRSVLSLATCVKWFHISTFPVLFLRSTWTQTI